jgi:hypothetical protein
VTGPSGSEGALKIEGWREPFGSVLRGPLRRDARVYCNVGRFRGAGDLKLFFFWWEQRVQGKGKLVR